MVPTVNFSSFLDSRTEFAVVVQGLVVGFIWLVLTKQFVGHNFLYFLRNRLFIRTGDGNAGMRAQLKCMMGRVDEWVM